MLECYILDGALGTSCQASSNLPSPKVARHLRIAAASTVWHCCRLIKAEQAVLEEQGCVVRLAGLYHAQVSLPSCSDP